MDIKKPEFSTNIVFEELVSKMKEMNIKKIDKCLVFAPDAIGAFLQKDYSNYFDDIKKHVSISINLKSVYIPVTPVCFASMFTGALPNVHGILKYEKPIIQIDTIFDRLIEENKKPAIVAVKNSSIDLIFRNRNLNYFSEIYDKEVIDRAISLIKDGNNDFILAYNQEYDDSIHDTTPFSKKSINALNNQNNNFLKLIKYFNEYWFDYNRLIMYTPDHGCHIAPTTSKGDHGLDIPEDMNIIHFCDIAKAGESL